MTALRRTARNLARYNAWANRVFYDAVFALPPGEAEKPRQTLFRNIVHTLNHNYVIDAIFRAHAEGRAHGYTARNTAEPPPLADLWRLQQEFDAWLVAWADGLDDAALEETVHFEFVGGGAGAMSRLEIIEHLAIHTAYHRGFAGDMFFQVPGCRPPVTDLTVFLRDHRPAAG
ncbi:MAG: DinB family protein [Burkholderiales bacterium]|nr:DinB family protein [Burkholderiales bacterium]